MGRHVAAFLLAALGGNSNPTEKDIKAIMNSVGIEPDATQLAIVIKELKGKDIFQVMEQAKLYWLKCLLVELAQVQALLLLHPLLRRPKRKRKKSSSPKSPTVTWAWGFLTKVLPPIHQ